MIRVAAAALAVALAAPVAAQGPWLLPSATTVGMVGEGVTVDAAASDDLFFPEHPLALSGIAVTAPDDTPGQPDNAVTGRYRTTFDLVLDKPGTWKIATAQSGVMGSFMLDGEQWRVGGRRGPPPGSPQPQAPSRPGGDGPPPGMRKSVATPADIPAGATGVKLFEMQARTETFVTAGVPNRTVLQPSGKGLEPDFGTHPDDLVSNEVMPLRFLIDGKPAAGIKVAIVAAGRRYRDADDPIQLVTAADGAVRIVWPGPGLYQLTATATDAHASDPKASERRMSYAVTLEVMAP